MAIAERVLPTCPASKTTTSTVPMSPRINPAHSVSDERSASSHSASTAVSMG